MSRNDHIRSAGNRLKIAPWLLLIGLLLEPASASPLSHCSSTETAFFSCPIVGSKKVVSLCGGGTKRGKVTWAQYRFGPISAPEIIFPTQKANSLELFGGWYEYHPGLHSMEEVWFHRGAYSYLVESSVSFVGDNGLVDEQKKRSSLVVFKHGQVIATFVCEGAIDHKLRGLMGLISDDQTRRP